MKIALIPARAGSKRIPRKNTRAFHGRPIMAYSIEAALGCGLFDQVVVSTDDDEIAAVARGLGATVPFVRPSSLADDHTGTNAVVRHGVRWFQGQGAQLEQVCCLYATAPFVTSGDLRAAHALLTPGVDFVFAATDFAFPVQRALQRDASGTVSPMFPQWISSRSQDLQPALHDAGQFYWGWAAAFERHDVVFLAKSLAFELPRYRVQDIDTADDWQRAEFLFAMLGRQSPAAH